MRGEKMKNVVFNVDNTNLYQDQVFFEGIYPVLFTCIDDYKNMYLAVCYQSDASKTCWLLAKVNPCQVIDLLQNKATIKELFECENLWNICKIANNSEKLVEKIKDYRNFDQTAFPVEGIYMDADTDEFSKEIELLKQFL